MAGGFRDLLAWLCGWPSIHPVWQTAGPYQLAAAGVFTSAADAADIFHAGTASAVASGGNVIIGQCNG